MIQPLTALDSIGNFSWTTGDFENARTCRLAQEAANRGVFRQAIVNADHFTRPVMFAHKTNGGAVKTYMATLLLINADGWVATAKHVLDAWAQTYRKSVDDAAKLKRRAAIFTENLPPEERARQLTDLQIGDDTIECATAMFGVSGSALTEVRFLPEVDLAIARLSPFCPGPEARFPTFKNPSKPCEVGATLCKYGFPLEHPEVRFDPATRAFSLTENPCAFPLEGMFARIGESLPDPLGPPRSHPLYVLEMTTPSLPGQSGGPVFDNHGTVWGINLRTMHYDLGFTGASVPQFLNVGVAVHPETLVPFLVENGVSIALSSY